MHSRLFWIFAALLAFSSATASENAITLYLNKNAPEAVCRRCTKGQANTLNERLVLVIGTPRSGTGYIWKVLRTCGIPVGHERDGDEGIVSWLFAVDSDNPAWGPKPVEYKFKHIFHQVRHPLKCIATMHLIVDRAWRYICREVPEINYNDPQLVRCAKMWVYWNLKAEKKAEMTYKVEAIKSAFPEMSRRLGVRLDSDQMKRVSTKTHSNEHDYVVTWKDLHEALEPGFYKKLLDQAKRYGYDVSAGYALIKQGA
ncbi:MAG: hypothetical protein LLG04_00815 [Parachlamydia sp.]|nr:hypothetical protein [Parachlamydia sp.]